MGSEFSLYNLVDPASLDGLILAADLGHGVSQNDMKQFCARFHPLPMLALSLEVPGIPGIYTDNLNGMRQAVQHLIEVHGLQRIAFVRGPQGQPESEQRYQAYVSALETHGIPLDERLVAPGDFTPESGRAAVALLLDERHADLQAVVAANDRMAFGVLDALQAARSPGALRNCPGRLRRCQRSACIECAPDYRAPALLRHRAAGCTAAAEPAPGGSVPSQTILPTELVIRWSCGCLPPPIQQVRCDEALMTPKPAAGTLAERRQPTIDALSQILHENALPGVLLADHRIRQAWKHCGRHS